MPQDIDLCLSFRSTTYLTFPKSELFSPTALVFPPSIQNYPAAVVAFCYINLTSTVLNERDAGVCLCELSKGIEGNLGP